MTKAQIIKRIQKAKDNIASQRDALRELQDEIDEYCDSSGRAVEDLGAAIDALSEYL